MRSKKISEIATLLYEKKKGSSLGYLADKKEKGADIEQDVEQLAKEIGISKDELKVFLKACFSEFSDLT